MTDSTMEWEQVAGAKAHLPQHVVYRSFATETVLLNVQTGYYHGMDPVGGRFFDVLRASGTVSEAVDVLAVEYEQPAERIREDMLHFCQELRGLELIELR
jgi:hypothetical protein